MKKISTLLITSVLGVTCAYAHDTGVPHAETSAIVSGSSTLIMKMGTSTVVLTGKPSKPLTEEEFKKLKSSEPVQNTDYKTPPPPASAFNSKSEKSFEEVATPIEQSLVKKSFFERIIDFLKRLFTK